jgi:SAM-dependent methyltransferase
VSSADAIAVYEANAAQMAPRYDALRNEDWYAPVRHLIPTVPCRLVDIGTATGRDARWFADMGHKVTAVEPAAAFLDAARTTDDRIDWLQDGLPDLPRLRARGERFDHLNLSAVWHHLSPDERGRGAAALAELAAPGATLVIALRHGPLPEGMPVYPVTAEDTAELFRHAGFAEVLRASAGSMQPTNRAAGVTWTWLVLRADRGKTP